MHPAILIGLGVFGFIALSGKKKAPTVACYVGPSDAMARCMTILAAVRPHEVSHLVEQARIWRLHGSLSPTQAAALALRGAGLVYVADVPKHDRWCPPVVTFARGGGDCDDHAIVGASLLAGLGVTSWVAIGQGPTGTHAWVTGHDPQMGPFVLEPQNGQLWWGDHAPGYRPQLLLGPHGCFQLAGGGWQRII
jgi:hypothetical protein